MEAGLEGGHEGDARQLLPQQPHRLDVGRIVGRGDLPHLLHRRQHVGGDADDAAHSPAMHRLEADRRHFVDAPERAAVAGELLEGRPEGNGVIGDRPHRLDVLAAGAGINPAFGGSDPLHASARQLLLTADRGAIGEVVEPVLEARRAEVGNEDDHRSFLRNPLVWPVLMPWPGPFLSVRKAGHPWPAFLLRLLCRHSLWYRVRERSQRPVQAGASGPRPRQRTKIFRLTAR